MKLIPTWPIAALCLALGVAGGAVTTRAVYVAQIEKTNAAHAEELRVREVQRARDEVAARQEEQRLVQRAGQIEQEKTDEIIRTRVSADALIERLREQATRKPACPSNVPQASASNEDAARRVILDRSGEGTVRLAQRAEEQRAALSACYKAYDSL